MHPEKAAHHLYHELIKVYDGMVFVGWRCDNGMNVLVVYVDHEDDPRLQLPKLWDGYTVEVQNVKKILSSSCSK